MTSKQIFESGITLSGFTSGDNSTRGFTLDEIESIRLEAYDQGMTYAAYLMDKASAFELRDLIINARHDKTSL